MSANSDEKLACRSNGAARRARQDNMSETVQKGVENAVVVIMQ
jgi:hypothetical protein